MSRVVLLFLLFLLSACARPTPPCEEDLVSISLQDRNGFSETVSAKERLDQYRGVNFLEPQPYEKVVRVFGRDKEGGIPSAVTTYYPNGQLARLLEVRNGRAFGWYREYHSNGEPRSEVRVIGGRPEIDEVSQRSWVFDGMARAWDEEGHLKAAVAYEKGELHGFYTEFHPNGRTATSIPYEKGVVNGVSESFFENGVVRSRASYCKGVLDGSCRTYWAANQLASDEVYCKGLLREGRYFNALGEMEEEIERGSGFRVVYNSSMCKEVHQFHEGKPFGTVKEYGERGQLVRLYHVADEVKHGTETYYFDPPFATEEEIREREPQPKLSVHWYRGEIQGEVKSWYLNGQLESQREIGHNRRNGVSTAWYNDGSLMLVEEYENDRLCKGEYYRRGEKRPISRVVEGNGVATLFDPFGGVIRKVAYLEGAPDESI